jgi:lysophospholipase L1-like esterase
MRRRILLAGLLLGFLATACGSSGPPTGPGPIVTPPPDQQPPPPPPPPPPTLGITQILCFGDSMTAGTVSPALSRFALDAGRPESYPFKLQTLLTSRYTAQTVTVLNAGRAGESAEQARDRFNGALSEAKPQLLLLMEGANDLNSPNEAIDVSEIVSAMEDMVRDATLRGIPVMVATIPPQRLGGPKTAPPELVEKFNRDLRLMASKKGAQLVDVNAMMPVSLIGQDGLHPTEEGYQKLAEIFFDAIKAKYEAPASTATR